MMTQREVISKFADNNRDRFNPFFFQRNEDEIITELLNVIKSCERENQYFSIKVDSYRVVDDYDEINRILYDYYENISKNKNKKRDNQYGYINLNESYIRLLIVRYYVKDRSAEDFIDVIIAVPRIVDKYYFKIDGIMRSTLFQIVDGSTYNNGTSNAKIPSITLKIIFMATRVTRYFVTLKSTRGEEFRATNYHSIIFSKNVAAAKYIFAKFGFYGALNFFGLQNAVFVTRDDPLNSNMYTFKIADGYFISTPKYLFDRVPLLQSVVATLYQHIVPGMPFETIFDNQFWVRSLGAEFSGDESNHKRMLAILDPEDETTPDTLEKGYSILDSFESIFDISTRNSIRLPMEDKETTYHILRWIMREFNALRMKDNLDISYKKIRFAEYIASLYAFKIAKGIYRISDMNKKANIVSIRKAIRTYPNFLLNAIAKSRMVSYRNMVSDMDSMQALKFTYKGVSGLGENSNKLGENSNQSIPDIYRSIHPSHIGRVDLDASSDGNPGITGTICPFASVYNGFFEEYQEPNTWEQEFVDVVNEYHNLRNIQQILTEQEAVYGVDNTEAIEVNSEIIASMQQIIKPIMFANEGEIVSAEEVAMYGY